MKKEVFTQEEINEWLHETGYDKAIQKRLDMIKDWSEKKPQFSYPFFSKIVNRAVYPYENLTLEYYTRITHNVEKDKKDRLYLYLDTKIRLLDSILIELGRRLELFWSNTGNRIFTL